MLKDVVALRGEVVVDEGVLAAAVPQIEGEAAEEADVVMLDVDGGAEAASIFGDIVGEDDGAHGGFTGAGFALCGSRWVMSAAGSRLRR